MFATKLGLFSIETIVVLILVWLDQLVKLITSLGLNLVGKVNKFIEHVSKPPILFNIFVKLVPVRPVKIVISLDTFQQHLLEMFFQPEMGEMEINDMFV
jgi:hypothetical protein